MIRRYHNYRNTKYPSVSPLNTQLKSETCNSTIKTHVQNDQFSKALELYCKLMNYHGFKPDNFTYPYILKASSQLPHLTMGLLIHNHTIKTGFDCNLFVVNGLILFYSYIGKLGIAQQLFDESHQRDIVTWTTIISGYARNNQSEQAIKLFHKMQIAGIKPNSFTIGTILPIFIREPLQIHGFLIKNDLESDIFVSTSLIHAYSNSGNTHFARKLFDEMPQRNLITWNAMITGYSQNGCSLQALKLFAKMQVSGRTQPDSFSIVAALSSCANLATLRKGKEIHGYVCRFGYFYSNVFVGNGLIDMYGKCGNVETAGKVFDKMAQKDVGSWTSLITCYGSHGQGLIAISIFEKMKQARVNPNSVTFTAILSACSHCCHLKEGFDYFYDIPRKFDIEPTMKHYGCMVDMMGRAGLLKEALRFINSMPIKPDFWIWETLLGASSIHGDAEIAEIAVKFLLELEPENSELHVQLSNISAKAGYWDEVANIRERMRKKRIQKSPGLSWILEDNWNYRDGP